METTFPCSLCGTLAATTRAVLLAMIATALLAGSLAALRAEQGDDDRGSGRLAQDADRLVPSWLAIRGSGRLGSDPDQPSSLSEPTVYHLLAWRGSGRIDENPVQPDALGRLQA